MSIKRVDESRKQTDEIRFMKSNKLSYPAFGVEVAVLVKAGDSVVLS